MYNILCTNKTTNIFYFDNVTINYCFLLPFVFISEPFLFGFILWYFATFTLTLELVKAAIFIVLDPGERHVTGITSALTAKKPIKTPITLTLKGILISKNIYSFCTYNTA